MRAPEIRLYEDEIVADCFAGGGGASTGIELAIGRSPDIAINHDNVALAMHAENHPTTKHFCESINDVCPRRAVGRGKKVGLAWFSPDCTYHSKARGGKPFRDRNKARRIRGLAGVVLRWAKKVRPRVIFVENVEEFKDWGPLGADNLPDPERRGKNFARWVSTLRNMGYEVQWQELRACDYGAPTSRKRLFVIARCDGRPIRWPAPTHGPRRPAPYRTAAECIDWSIPVPSIFLDKDGAKAWAREHGQEAPKRPLSDKTLARIARGIQRFVIDAAEPFIVNVRHDGGPREYSLFEPMRTIPASDREVALVAPTLIQTSYGERDGQAPRVLDLHAPLGTIVAQGVKHSLVTAFLAKHNGTTRGHEATGQMLLKSMDTITTRDSKALVTSHLMKLRGTCRDGQMVTKPCPTLTAGGNHVAEVRAFLVKFYGTTQHGQSAQLPLGTVTTKDRFGLITVMIAGEEYVIADIGMRMLSPRELFHAQGFRADYRIESAGGRRLTKKTQTRLVGNSVPPPAAAAIVRANMEEAIAA